MRLSRPYMTSWEHRIPKMVRLGQTKSSDSSIFHISTRFQPKDLHRDDNYLLLILRSRSRHWQAVMCQHCCGSADKVIAEDNCRRKCFCLQFFRGAPTGNRKELLNDITLAGSRIDALLTSNTGDRGASGQGHMILCRVLAS